jgi:hypothetical protein
MKVGSKRRRTRQEIEDQKADDLIKNIATEEKLRNIQKLQQDLENAQ